MKRVLAITNNLKQASFRLRLEAIAQPLAARGIELDIHVRPRKILARRKLLRKARDYDAVLLQRKLLDPSDVSLLQRNAGKVFFDVDDAVMYHNRPVGAFERWRTWRRFLAVAKHTDVVVAGNQYLADLFTSHGTKKSIVLPTVVEVSHYAVKSHAPTRSPALVWIGSKSTLPYVRKILPALGAAAKEIPGLNLIIIADDTITDSPLPITHIAWSADTECQALCRGDIGIAPTPEDRWTLGKCGFKIVQYMAAGLPVIASPVGANREIVVQDKTGYLPTGADEWIQAAIRLSKSDSLRSAMGQAGRKRVEEHYSIERAADVWADLLK